MNRKKEIIVFTDGIGNCGIQRVLSELTSYWVKVGNQVSIVYIEKDNGSKSDFVWESGVELKAINVKGGFFSIYKTLVQEYKKILKSKPDAVAVSLSVMSNFAIGACARQVGNKIILSDRNDPTQRPKGRLKQFFRNVAFKRADVLVLQTKDVQKYYEQKIHRTGIIIPNPINREISSIDLPLKRRPVIVSASRLNKQKNLRMLIKAFNMFSKDHSEYVLEIYGRGEEENDLRQLAKELSIEDKVIFKGFSQDLYHDIVDCAVYVCSSDYEGISNSLIEALGLGIPTISTDCPVGGSKMLIENEVNGILIKVGDTDDLCRQMSRIVESAELADKLSRNAVKIRDRFKVENIAQKWLDVM